MRKGFGWSLVLNFILFCSLGCGHNQSTVGTKKVKYNLPRLLRVYKNGYESYQSAVVVGYNGYLLTTAHTTEVDRIEFRILLDDGTVQSFTPRIVAKDGASDLALLKVETKFPSVASIGQTPDRGGKVYLQSYALNPERLLVDLPAQIVQREYRWSVPSEGFDIPDGIIISAGRMGASGSPVFNEATADLVALYKMTGNKIATGEVHGFLIGPQTIRNFLMKNNIRDSLE